MTSTWETISAKKRQALADSIPAEWRIPTELMPPESQDDVTGFPEQSGWFTKDELAITGATVSELLPKLASGELSSEAVTRAFCKRAAAAHQLVNCLSETLFEAAITTAKALDAHLAKTGKPLGPLHGLPISLKDNFNLKGLDSTVGFTSHVGDPASYDAVLAEILREAGAVFYVKTNVPTAMMIAESVNNTFGRTVNPQNRRVTSGGSSGGESALIAFGGSPIGVGTDIGGSLRIPAACTGIFTIKPSFGRFPTLRCRSGMPGQEAVASINGPMTQTLADLELYSRTVVGAEPWRKDPRSLPIPWRPVSLPASGKLKIGVMWDDGMALPTPPVTRALREAVDKLKAAGHEIVEWSSEDQARGLELLGRMFVADGGEAIRNELERTGEPMRPEMVDQYGGSAKSLTGLEYWQLHAERQDYQKKYLDRWLAAGIDALLCPTTPYSSVENGKFRHVGYTGVYNVLDYSCISFPTGVRVDQAVDVPQDLATYKPLSDLDKEIQQDYDPKIVNGLMVNLQLVAQRLEEEKCVEMCKVVLGVLGQSPSGSKL
ncbi:amidase [Microdochium trichocladiopsis]|uniref:amidase n=1 Tax=Microdochium trichocladiopsis TaxID=1682393 RepID=A0A9P8YF17_9PEZI|nr:amidase [Microdochium trichocladiopsis]KAH7038255.1 amidase [Microdochium trichocladiopsis]